MCFFFFFQKQVQANICVTKEMVKEALDMLRGAVMIVYPMGLPPHDPIRMEFEGREDLAGTQVDSSACCWEINRVTHLDSRLMKQVSQWFCLHSSPLHFIFPWPPLPSAHYRLLCSWCQRRSASCGGPPKNCRGVKNCRTTSAKMRRQSLLWKCKRWGTLCIQQCFSAYFILFFTLCFLDYFICILYLTFTKLPHLTDRTAGSLFSFKYRAFFTLQ